MDEIKRLIKKLLKHVLIFIIIIVVAIIAALIGIPALIAALFGGYGGASGATVTRYGGRSGTIQYSSLSPTEEDLQYLIAVTLNERGGDDISNEQLSYVVSVVLNRTLVGGIYGGNTIKEIVLAPAQFSRSNCTRWEMAKAI